jgi:hypothetical protein
LKDKIDKIDEHFYTSEFYKQYLEYAREYVKDIIPGIVDKRIKTKYPNLKMEKIGNEIIQEKKSENYYLEKCNVIFI